MVNKKKKVIPTAKQKKFAAYKSKGLSSYQAAIKAGYSPNTAKNPTPNILDRRGTKEELTPYVEALRKVGINKELKARKLKEGLEATSLYGKDSTEHEDYSTRLAYMKYIDEIEGIAPSKKLDVTSNGKSIDPTLNIFLGARNDTIANTEGSTLKNPPVES